MSELCLSSTSRAHLCSLLKSDFFLFCSFILSHPLHFTFFIFFSPYILKLLSFLFPLFLTTSLFLLAFLTFSPSFINGHLSKQASEVKVSFLTAAYHAVVEKLRSKIDDQNEKIIVLEDFEAFRILFENPTIHDDATDQVDGLGAESINSSFQDAVEAPAFACFAHQDVSLSPNEALASKPELHCLAELKSNWGAIEDDKKIVSSWQELDEFEKVRASNSVEKVKIEPSCTDANKATEKHGEKSPLSNGSEEAGSDKIRQNNSVGKGKGREKKSKLLKAHSHSVGASTDYTTENGDYSVRIQSSPSLDYNLGSYGSMRKEKEWRRTLACKLFEERNNADESEGMDLLWETYETESTKNKAKIKNNGIKKKKDKSKYEIKYHGEDQIDSDREEGDEEDESDGRLCCLQALKFSAGKMNLGMGRPNLVKISKAIKGIGWLHNLKRHSKKVHNGDKY